MFFINKANVRLGVVKFRFSKKVKKLQNEHQARTHNSNVGRIFTLKFIMISSKIVGRFLFKFSLPSQNV